MGHGPRRWSHVFLCLVPLLAIGFASVRPLRIPGAYQVIGTVLFIPIAVAVWALGARALRDRTESDQRLAFAGGFFIVPFALIALFWVGLGPPWVATPRENVMRYLVLLFSSISVSVGFIVLKEALSESGERTYSTIGFSAAMLAGSGYLIWMSFLIGTCVATLRNGKAPPEIAALSDVFEVLLDVACLLTYLATAAFAAAFGRVRWLGRSAKRAYMVLSLLAILCLVIRGASFLNPALAASWYMQPGFIVGIPAIPFLMPFLLGVVLLRRAGERKP